MRNLGSLFFCLAHKKPPASCRVCILIQVCREGFFRNYFNKNNALEVFLVLAAPLFWNDSPHSQSGPTIITLDSVFLHIIQ